MKNKESLTVIQVNDNHAYFDLNQALSRQGDDKNYIYLRKNSRISNLIGQIHETKDDDLLFCGNADSLNSTFNAFKTHGAEKEPDKNLLNLDTMLSRWEYAYGEAVFKKLISDLNFPVLAINIFDKKTKELIFPPCIVKKIGSLKVGLIGIASNKVDKTIPTFFSEGLKFTHGREELPEVIKILRTIGHVDLIILISHLGFSQDIKLISEVDGVDLCLSGQTENRIDQSVHIGKTLIIQSGCHGSCLGKFDLKLINGEIISYEHQLIEVESNNILDFDNSRMQ